VTLDSGPRAALERLVGSTAPLLLGVRHHSPAVSSIVEATLDSFAPTHVLVELPEELGEWLPWVGHADAVAPLALAATVDQEAGSLAFYPFADFSPELMAIRWAVRRGVKIEAFDLPVGARTRSREEAPHHHDSQRESLMEVLTKQAGADGFEELWDRLVEARAFGQEPEAIRGAALLLGWTLRVDAALAGTTAALDLAREAHMRARLDAALAIPDARVVAVVGSFHAAALLEPRETSPAKAAASSRKVTTALLPYSFPLLDSRSGYPAGIRDPAWQQRVVDALALRVPIDEQAAEAITLVSRAVRASRHAASFPDAREAARLAMDLARLRGLTTPSRRELLEGIEAAMCQGEVLGRGRVVARALSEVMIGDRRGVLADGTPRSGLAPHVEALFRELGFPGPGDTKTKEMSLDALRSSLDRRREIALERLVAADIVFAERIASGPTAGGIDALGSKWSLHWSPSTAATIELASLFGATLIDAAGGKLRDTRARALEKGTRVALVELDTMEAAARSGIANLVIEGSARLSGGSLADARFADLVRAQTLVGRIGAGHFAALPASDDDAVPEAPVFQADLSGAERAVAEALVASLDGVSGSIDVADAIALRELTDAPARAGLGEGRLHHAIARLAREGSPLMRGAGAVLVFFVGVDLGRLQASLTSLLDAPVEGGADRAAWMRGALSVGMPALEAEPAFVNGIVEAIASWPDDGFLGRLPSLREGFDVISPRARTRLLRVLLASIEGDGASESDAVLAATPEEMAAFAAADLAARAALLALGLSLPELPPSPAEPHRELAPKVAEALGPHAISIRDRLRLVLGREREKLVGVAGRASVVLDRLYGRGEGEGANDPGEGGGTDSAFPSVRLWSEEISTLFGDRVREEILGRAAERGTPGAALELDPSSVRPSVELLEQILSLKGGLSEGDLGKLRALVRSIVEALVAELATRVRPALTGLVSPRATPRGKGPIDLRRTIQKNLGTARRREGVMRLAPERLVFRERQKRSLDWHVVLVVDVSGSMEPSVIYSALMAAILSGMPALTVKFLAFNERVVDLSEHAGDPLALLLEIAIGGGTLIGQALAYARSLVTVPSRTLLCVVSDFEDAGPSGLLLGEVRALVEGGVKALGLAALDDHGAPRFARGVAEGIAAAGMPVAALSPLELARWIGEQIR